MTDGQGDTADRIQPFRVNDTPARGRAVRLDDTIDTILSRHDYPEAVARNLGQLLLLTAMLAQALKFDGVFTAQISGKGPVSLMVADCTTDGRLRGCAQFDTDALEAIEPGGGNASVPRLFGEGYLAITLDQGPHMDRYQGVVALEGESLADCLHGYFRQSEQVETAIRLAVDRSGGNGECKWRAGGVMLQRMPDEAGVDAEQSDEGWRRAVVLASSVRDEELLDDTLPMRDLLYRLFNEDGVWVYEPASVGFGCRCSRERVEWVLRGLTDAEVEEMSDDGEVEVRCEFCNTAYHYDEAALTELRAGGTGAENNGAEDNGTEA